MLNRYLRSIFFGLILFSSFGSKAQEIDTVKVDTLIQVLTLQKKDERTVNAYLDLSEEYIKITDYATALTYADLANELARSIEYTEGQLEASLTMAHIYLAYHLDYQNSITYYDQALQLANELNSDPDRIRVYRGYALVYASVKNYPMAVAFNNEAIKIAELMDDDRLISDLNAYGGSIYEEMGDTTKAIECFEKVESIEQENNFMNTSFASLAVIAHYYFLVGDNEKSLKMWRSALKKYQRMQDHRWTSYAHAEIARVYIVEGSIDKAEQHALKGLEIAEYFELNKERSDNYLVLSMVYKANGDEANQKLYEEKYNNLIDSVMVEILPRGAVNEEEMTASEMGEGKDPTSQFLSAIIILGLTGLLVFLSGFSRKKG